MNPSTPTGRATERTEFFELARTHSVVPVSRRLLADFTTPVAAFARLCRGEEPGFLLESVDHGGQWGRWSFVGRRPAARYTLQHGRVSVDLSSALIGDPTVLNLESADGGILGALDGLLRSCTAPVSEDLPPLHAGLVGYLGYDVVREVERLPDSPPDDRDLPDAILSAIGELAAYDHWRQQATLIVNVYLAGNETADRLEELWNEANFRLDQIALDGASPLDEPLVDVPQGSEVPPVRASMDREQYMHAAEVAKEHILAGDIFQVVLATRFEAETSADPLDIYRVLRQINPSPYMYFVREPELVLVGCSPEPMVQLAESLEAAAWVSGATRSRTLRRILLPILFPSVHGAVFLLSMALLRDISSAILLFSGSTRVIAVSIFQFFDQANWGLASALSVIATIIIFLVMTLIIWLVPTARKG